MAYVGEVMRRAIDGVWEMRWADDVETWLPYVASPREGRDYAPFREVKDLLYETSDPRACLSWAMPMPSTVPRQSPPSDSTSTPFGAQLVSQQEAQELLKLPGCEIVPDFDQGINQVYRLGDGRMLVVSGASGAGQLWPSKEALKALMDFFLAQHCQFKPQPDESGKA